MQRAWHNTNPMSILTWSVYDAFPQQRVVGLCHNVQSTAHDLAGYLCVEPGRLSYDCAGINHMTWFLRLAIDGEDAYPRLRKAADDPRIFAQDKVRFELLRHLGWFVSESSEHTAEYTRYFLARFLNMPATRPNREHRANGKARTHMRS